MPPASPARSFDFGIGELPPGIFDLRLRGRQGTLALRHEGLLRLQLLRGNERLRVEHFETLQVAAYGAQLRFAQPELPFHLRQPQLIGQRIDFREQLPRSHLLALGKRDPQQLSVNAAAHRHDVQWHHRADGAQMYG
jgi:hypothetical protein